MKRNKLLLASTFLLSMTTFGAAYAQDSDAPAADSKEKATEVVVTGTRIRRNDATSTSAVQVITSERTQLQGVADTTKMLQSATTAATSGQINNNYTGYLVTGGPGVNSISLRGLGANRTLVILNGHRVGPAGVGGTVGPADLNTIPNYLVDRVDILKDGASSLYGSDAVAGVVNVITKKNYTGGELSVYANLPTRSGGESYNISLTQGMIKDRFHASFGLDYYKQDALTLGDRPWTSCPQDYAFDKTTGARADLIDPDTGTYVCNILLAGRVDNLSNGRSYVYDSSAHVGGGYHADDLNGFHRVSATYAGDPTSTRASKGEAPIHDPKYNDITIQSPTTRKSVSVFWGYDLNDTTEVYGDILLNRRESSQHRWRQLFPTVHFNNPNNPFRLGNTSGYAPGYARSIIAMPSDYDQQVSYSRFMVGIKGDLPDMGYLHNWNYDIAVQMSDSKATYGNNFVYNDRVLATTQAAACNTAYLFTATSCPTGGVNYFRQSTVETGVFTPEESAFLFGYEQGKTSYKQSYIDASFSGDLFELPAGTVGAAVGFMLRHEALDDQPGEQAANSNLWGQTTAGRTKGSDDISEAFLQFDIPVVKDLPFFHKLNLDLSTRYSDYKSYGSSSTYKIGLDWALSKSVRVRGSKGTSFRAPALYELYLGNQLGFLGQSSIDPCYNLDAYSNVDPTVAANCAAQNIPTNYTAAGYGSAYVYAGGGAGILKAETSDNKTLGLVWTPSFAKLEMALDYFETTIDNQVSKFGAANILYQCYATPGLTSPFCSLFTRDNDPTSTSYHAILEVHDNYLNVAKQQMRGYDLFISYRHNFDFGKFTFESQNSLIHDWTNQLLDGSDAYTWLGTTGNPKYVGNASFKLEKGDWTYYWDVSMVGKTNDMDWYGTDINPSFYSTGQAVRLVRNTDFYTSHTFSVRKKFDKWTVIGTVANAFDEAPPYVSSGVFSGRLGNVPLTSQYDQLGRSFALRVQRRW